MKDCKTKMLHKILGLPEAANFQYFFICLLITLPLILASLTLKRKYIKLLKIYELEIYYLNVISPVFELGDVVETTDPDLIANAFQQHKTPCAILSLLSSLKGLFPYLRWVPNVFWGILTEGSSLRLMTLVKPIQSWSDFVLWQFHPNLKEGSKVTADASCLEIASHWQQNFCANIRDAYISFFFIPDQFPFSWHQL